MGLFDCYKCKALECYKCKYKKRLRIVQMIENVALLFCASVIVFVVYNLVNYFAEKQESDKMERAIGEIFEFDGEKLKVVECEGCKGCFFDISYNCDADDYVGECSDYFRKDGKNVIFKLLEE